MKKTIKQKILDHLNAGYTLTYGQANTITNSQSGYRRFQEILKEDPDKYRFVRVKSDNGGYYNVFAKDSVFRIVPISSKSANGYAVCAGIGDIYQGTISETKKEAKAHIKKVIR